MKMMNCLSLRIMASSWRIFSGSSTAADASSSVCGLRLSSSMTGVPSLSLNTGVDSAVISTLWKPAAVIGTLWKLQGSCIPSKLIE